MPETEQLKIQLAALPSRERAEIARFLIEPLDEADERDWDAAWESELDRRSTEIDAGIAVGKPAHEVFDELRRKFD